MDKIGVRELFGVIKNIYLNRETGLLVLEFPAGKRLIIFINGSIRYARSGVDGEQLGAFLVREGHLNEKNLKKVLSEAQKAERRLGEYLVEEQIVLESDIQDTVKKLVQHIVVRPFFEDVEEMVFEKKGVSLDPALMLNISTGNILLEAIRQLEEDRFLEDVFEEYRDSIPVFMDNPMLLFQKVNLTPMEGFVFSRIDGKMSVAEIDKIASMPHNQYVKTIFGLNLIGLVDFATSEYSSFDEDAKDDVMSNLMEQPVEEESPQGRAEPLLSEEDQAFIRDVEDLHERMQGLNHYDMLGVTQRSSQGIIKKYYYKLMKSYHPDRFAHRQHEEISRKLDDIVSRLTEAYQTLKDDALRNQYDKKLQADKEEQPAARSAGGRQTSKKEVHFRDALFFVSQGRYTEGIEMLNRCIQVDPHDARFYLELAKLQVGNPMWQKKAEENLIAAIQFDATKIEPYLLLGQMYLRNERLESAERYFTSALSLEPENEEAAEGLREIHKRSKKGGFMSRISDLFS